MRRLAARHQEQAVYNSGGSAKRNQGIHIRCKPEQRFESGCVKTDPGGNDRNGQKQLNPRIDIAVDGKIRQSEHVVHCRIKQQNGKDKRSHEPVKIRRALFLILDFPPLILLCHELRLEPDLPDRRGNLLDRDRFRVPLQRHRL